jgi:Zn-dependent M28 family amino/carboxypeptidase
LLGSQAIAKAYEDEGRKVKAMLQMDMTGELLFSGQRQRDSKEAS